VKREEGKPEVGGKRLEAEVKGERDRLSFDKSLQMG